MIVWYAVAYAPAYQTIIYILVIYKDRTLQYSYRWAGFEA